MALKSSKLLDEICYPFIHETSYLCDYEVLTDELATLVGMALSSLPTEEMKMIDDLHQLQPLIFHANGSIRGRLALSEENLDWLKERLNAYKAGISSPTRGFVLPRGTGTVPYLHQARSVSKKAIRALVRVDSEGIAVPELIPRFLNICCNFFFVLTQYLNQQHQVEEPVFISRSYGRAL